MIGICPKCGNYEWDKEVSAEREEQACPKCGHVWKFRSLPVFILTGCSGVGKTTTAQELLQRDTDYIVMDGDIFGCLGEDYQLRAEQLLNFTKNIMQGGKPLLWTMAGALEKLRQTYNSRYIREFYFLALVCDRDVLEKHMREGRKITQEAWIQASIEHNRYLASHDQIEGIHYDSYDITGKTAAEAADYVDAWIRERLN